MHFYLSAIDLGVTTIKTGQFLLSFSILVFLHELGHFIPAKLFKCRVDKFYMFFNPWFSLFKFKRGETEYGIGWFPMGGYVKIAGMIDESMDKEQMKLPPQDYEFRSKPAWQRLIIMLGGVIVNVLLAFAIFIGITAYWGEETLPAKNVKYGIKAGELARKIGLTDGDNIVAIDNKPVLDYGDVQRDIYFKKAKSLLVERAGKTIELSIPPAAIAEMGSAKSLENFFDIQVPVVVDNVLPTAVFTRGELNANDTLIGINQHRFQFFHELVALRKQYSDSMVDLFVKRGSDTLSLRCLMKKGMIGFRQQDPGKIFGTVVHRHNLFESVPIGSKMCIENFEHYISGFKRIFSGEQNPNESLGGVISMVNTFPSYWDWQRFWTFTALFSIMLAFMNILPIPALDGGHALFTLVEIITGKKPSDKFMEYAQMVGMALLLGLMAYAFGLDIWRIIK